MYLVDEINQSNALVELYEQCYQKRYGIKPAHTLNNLSHTLCKDIVKMVGGIAQARLAIEHYLLMNNDWFVKKAHPLDTLKSDINIVLVSLGDRKKATSFSSDIKLHNKIACDSCWQYFEAIYDMNTQWDKVFVRCPTCTIEDNPVKHTILPSMKALDYKIP